MYQPSEGRICIDDLESTQIDPASLRKQIAYVPQHTDLFHGTIRDNITMGAGFVDDSILMRSANISGVSSFINHHPDGFDRQVGERGSQLSGGQQQAISISRALLLDPAVYLFDEPSSSMDSASMIRLVKQLKTTLVGKTFILISHKPSMLDLVDRIIVMDKGAIIADGPKAQIYQQFSKPNE